LLRIQKSLVVIDLETSTAEQAIQVLADMLHQEGMVDEHYGAATIDRERKHATGLPTKPFSIAFPHADADGVVQSALAVASLKKPVVFRNMADPEEELEVELVIMLANKTPEEQINTLQNLAVLFGTPQKLSDLKNIQDPDLMVDWLKKELIQGG
jgi:PTS system galactitol-specific IIA component